MESSHDESSNPAQSERAGSSPRYSEPANFLQDLDRRQNDVIRELDQLNDRIDQVLVDWNRQEYGEEPESAESPAQRAA